MYSYLKEVEPTRHYQLFDMEAEKGNFYYSAVKLLASLRRFTAELTSAAKRRASLRRFTAELASAAKRRAFYFSTVLFCGETRSFSAELASAAKRRAFYFSTVLLCGEARSFIAEAHCRAGLRGEAKNLLLLHCTILR